MGLERNRGREVVLDLLLLLLFAAVPAVAVGFTAAPPRDRYFHVESFRYGKEPGVIRVNRGDRVHLTFSSRDTAHSFFLQEFDLDAKILPGGDEVDLLSALHPNAGSRRVREVVFTADPPGLLSPLYSRFDYRCHVWCGPMHAFEQGALVIGPNRLLAAALGLLLGIPTVGLLRLRRRRSSGLPPSSPPGATDLFARWPRLLRFARRPGAQLLLVVPAAVLLYVVILTTLFGTQMSGRNLGVMLLWVVWLFLLVVVFTPLGGRVWCLVCPLPLLGESLQRARGRGRPALGLGLPWPRFLDHAWPRTLAFLVLGTFTAALVAVPRVTGWVLAGLVLLSAALALVFERRAFCRFLCPIHAFVGLYGTTGKLALRRRSAEVCARCRAKPCLAGNSRGYGCPYGLCVEEIRENNDCGLCLECVKTCPSDNVGLYWRPFAAERGVRDAGEAWLSIVMFVLAVAYCVLYLGPWAGVRDLVNILDKGNWAGFAAWSAVLWTAALAAVPALVYGISRAGRRLAGLEAAPGSAFRACAGALVPLGLFVWIAFVIPMLLVNFTFVVQSLSDPFGWGWNLLGAANTPWRQIWPAGIPLLQAAAVLAGAALALRHAHRAWRELAGDDRAAVRGAAPLSLALLAVSAWLLVFFTN